MTDDDLLALPAFLVRAAGSPEEPARRRARAAREGRAADAEAPKAQGAWLERPGRAQAAVSGRALGRVKGLMQ